MAEKIRRYQRQTATFCYYLSQLAEISRKFEEGDICDVAVLSELLENVAYYREEFLKAKSALGLTQGDAFIAPQEVYQFDIGFSLRNGRIVGDVSEKQVRKACLLWLEEFPTDTKPSEAECVRYEVACLCIMLSGSRARIEKRLRKKEKRSLKEMMRKWIEKIRLFYLDEAYE